jgi:SpoVK/Ycf46/Vps4 family AAA+-type ATPase
MVAIGRDAALLALEESDRLSTTAPEMPAIAMRHLVQALQDTQRQITPEMIAFYASYRGNARGSDQ